MDWQAQCGMCFRNVAGWTGTERFEVRRWPIVNYFLGSRDLPSRNFSWAFLANNGVTAVVIDDSDPHAAEWDRLLAVNRITSTGSGSVASIRIEANALRDLKGLTGLEMEQRATRYVSTFYWARQAPISRRETPSKRSVPTVWSVSVFSPLPGRVPRLLRLIGHTVVAT